MGTPISSHNRLLKSKLLSHIAFWVIYVLIVSVLASLNEGSFKDHLINYLILLPSQLLAAYTFNYYLIPQLYLKKKYVQFGVLSIASAYVFVAFARFCNVHIAEPLTRKGSFEKETIVEILTDPLYLVMVYFPAVYMVVFLLFVVKSLETRFEERHQLEVLQKEKANNELKFLKAQIHPHFLFNTLNSIYSLTLSKSDVAPEVVLKLSDLLDYMLYQCNAPRVALEKEIQLIQDYIDLEKIRYGSQLDLKFTHQIGAKKYQIAPLILLSFVENAFKHGASGNPTNPQIHIDLQANDEQVLFRVFNTKKENSGLKSNENGIGNSNTLRQLELHYPDVHHLNVNDTAGTYEVELTIDVSK